MCDHWMPSLTLSLTREQFQQLPRHPAYRYEYLNGQAFLTPNAKHYHALLALAPGTAASSACLRPVRSEDFAELEGVFAAAFYRHQPFASLDEELRRDAARDCLERTRAGGDGPWIERASFVAEDQGRLIGAALVTLLPEGDASDWSSYYWDAPPPADAIERRLGRPHLTWIFMDTFYAGQGTGTALLAVVGRELADLGFTELVSTFQVGNDSSLLWHWRNGFRLLPHPLSRRRLRRSRGPADA